MMQQTPVVLDIDRSVGPLMNEQRLPLADWQAGQHALNQRLVRRIGASSAG